jgi:hypothetical protein
MLALLVPDTAHEYVEPAGPVGLPPKVTVAPLQAVTSAPAFGVNCGVTVTTTWSVTQQNPGPPLHAVMVYVVVEVGVATGSAHVVQLNPEVGDHEYDNPEPEVAPPLTVELMVTELPAHTARSAPAVNVVGLVHAGGQTTFTVKALHVAPPYPST